MGDAYTRERDAHAELARWSADRVRRASLRIINASRPLVDIEASAACNLRCEFCPRDAMTRPQRIMTPETFDAVERLLPETAIVMFAGLGEPLTNHHLPAYVARLKRRGISSCVITNGVLLSPVMIRELLDAGLDQFQVSVHALDEELARALMPGVQLARVIENLHHLAATKPAEVRAQINFVACANNGDQRPAVEALARGLGFEFFHRVEHNRGGHLRRSAGAASGCGVFSLVTFITARGDVLSCVNDVDGRSRLGDASTLDWDDVLRWKRETVRDDHWFPACARCDDGYRWVLLAEDR